LFAPHITLYGTIPSAQFASFTVPRREIIVTAASVMGEYATLRFLYLFKLVLN
jgi:hypothetical protein